ncbi:cobalt/nickel transport system permease protein [Solirubrobacter pauli]|uniref:Cobalt/nickel transport system permease protein n=1 Tax=Solirubrobacter pauli TaxID=166793 RepID=A0A660LDH9_9ACTN|nr:energy-coupling factor transporter transmembrane component T [Solirubrobacter pauli]RKQ91930.1 cobalt/nickel transport system permease protein [Solirubrobacter pauli]
MSTLHESGVVGDSPIHRLDPRAKLLGLLSVTLIAVSSAAWPVHAACAAALLAVAAAARIGPRVIVRRARLILLPVLLVALFAPTSFATVGAKAVIGTVSAVLLGATTSFPDVLHALERLRTPRLLVLIAAFMYRYLFTIVDEVQRMRAALTARGYAPRHALQVQALGRVATALFLRTYERAERVHLAMLARGFDERMPRLQALTFRRADGLFLTALLPLLAVRVAA